MLTKLDVGLTLTQGTSYILWLFSAQMREHSTIHISLPTHNTQNRIET